MPTLRDKVEFSSEPNDQQLQRFLSTTTCKTYEDIATFLGISVSAVQKDVKNVRNGADIPDAWLLFLLRVKNVHPEWILRGHGSSRIYMTPEGQYETGNAFEERQRVADALRGLSSVAIVEEILRRIARA